MSQILTPPLKAPTPAVGHSKVSTGLQLQRPSVEHTIQTTDVQHASFGRAQTRPTSSIVEGGHGMQHSTVTRIPPNLVPLKTRIMASQNRQHPSPFAASRNATQQQVGSQRALAATAPTSPLGIGVNETQAMSSAYRSQVVHHSSPSYKSRTTVAATQSCSHSFDEQGVWMLEGLRRIWPSIVEFMGNKFKAKLKAKHLVLDSEVDKFVAKLSAIPPTLPVTVEWGNEFCEVIWPLLRVGIDQVVHQVVLPKVKAKLPSFLQSIDINPCSIGHTPPRVIGPIKVVPDADECGGVLVQIDGEYVGDADIEVNYKGRKMGVKEMTFKASLCLEIHGMMPVIPFFRGLSVYMCKPCEFGLKWAGMLEYLELTLVEEVIKKVVSDIVGSMFLLPSRFGWVYDPSSCNVFEIKKPKPMGCLQITLVRAKGLIGVDRHITTLWTGKKKSDPFVTIAVGSESWRSATEWESTDPEWDENENRHLFLVDMPEHQRVSIQVWDDGTLQKLKANALRIDRGTEGDELARNLDLRIQDLLEQPDGVKLHQEILIPERMISLETVWPDEVTCGSTSISEGHRQQEEQGLITRGLSWAKDRLVQGTKVDKTDANARIWLRVHWRPISYSTPAVPSDKNQHPQTYLGVHNQHLAKTWSPVLQAPREANHVEQWRENVTTRGTGIVSATPKATRPAVGLQTERAGSDVGSSTDDSEEEKPQPPGGWPTQILRVGINFVEGLLCAEHDNVTRFFVTCEVTPSVNGDGFTVTDSVENVTTTKTKKRPALATVTPKHQLRISKFMSDDERLKEKIGMMAQFKVPVHTIADVLDIDHPKVRMLMTDATVDMTGRRDVVWDEAFIFYLWEPTIAQLRLEVFKEELKQKPVSVGNICFQVGALLQQHNFSETMKRLPLFAPSGSGIDQFTRISLHCQLWPIVTKVPPHLHEKRQDAAELGLSQFAAEDRHVTSLWVLSAQDLRNVDFFGGKSDPYCICTIEKGEDKQKLFQTKVVDDDPDPKWDHGPVEVTWTTEKLLRFQVYDKDFLKKDDILGECTLSREECFQGLYTDLTLGDGNGWLRIKVAPIHQGMPAEVPWKEPTVAPSLKVWIHSAEALKDRKMIGDESGVHPYIVCMMAGQQQFRTEPDCGLNPTWEHGPEIIDIGHSAQLLLEVRDRDTGGARKFGTVRLSREECIAGMSRARKSLGVGKGTLMVTVAPASDNRAFVKLEVTILSANGLRKADLTSESDPYVVCKLKGKEKIRTEVIWDEPNPVWNHGPVEILMHREKEIRFEVYDKDMFRQGDLLGSAGVNREVCLHGFQGHLDLGEGNGSLHVNIRALDTSTGPMRTPELQVTGKTVSSNVDSKVLSRNTFTATKSEGLAVVSENAGELIKGAKNLATGVMSIMGARLAAKRSDHDGANTSQDPQSQ